MSADDCCIPDAARAVFEGSMGWFPCGRGGAGGPVPMEAWKDGYVTVPEYRADWLDGVNVVRSPLTALASIVSAVLVGLLAAGVRAVSDLGWFASVGVSAGSLAALVVLVVAWWAFVTVPRFYRRIEREAAAKRDAPAQIGPGAVAALPSGLDTATGLAAAGLTTALVAGEREAVR